MRRSICFTEPKYALAGQEGTWRFVYTPASPLPKGTLLLFDLSSLGRDLDWQLPATGGRTKGNLIWLDMPNGKTASATEVEVEDSPLPQYEFELPSEVMAGEQVAICLGSPDGKKGGTRAQTNVQRRRPFYLFIDPKGKGDYKDSELFTVDVRGNELKQIRILAPSMVNKNQRFDVMVRFEDEFGNLTGRAPEGTLIELSYNQLRENISWKLFVPETGFIALPNLYFNEEGVYRIQLKNLSSGEAYFSDPIKCFAGSPHQLLWGTFHGEMELYDSEEGIESLLRHARDEHAMLFMATSPFESEEETPAEIWKLITSQVTEFNEDERYSTLLGMQWVGEDGEEGVHQLVYAKDNKPILRKKETKSNQLKKIFKTHLPKDLMAIPSFTMGKGVHYDFKDHTPEFEPVAEIYNAWGSSECTSKEGNPFPISGKGKGTYSEEPKGSIRNALANNVRVGFVAGGYDDRGIYEGLYDTNQVQYTPGVTGVLATEHTREAILTAVRARLTFATSGARMVIGMTLANSPMGSELNTTDKPGLNFNRHLAGYAVGTDVIKEVQLIRNGKVIKSFKPNEKSFDFTYDDTDALEKVTYPAKGESPPFVYYYMRVIQKDDHLGWTSPIWVDHTPKGAPKKKK